LNHLLTCKAAAAAYSTASVWLRRPSLEATFPFSLLGCAPYTYTEILREQLRFLLRRIVVACQAAERGPRSVDAGASRRTGLRGGGLLNRGPPGRSWRSALRDRAEGPTPDYEQRRAGSRLGGCRRAAHGPGQERGSVQILQTGIRRRISAAHWSAINISLGL
jgi:hypothetical protein